MMISSPWGGKFQPDSDGMMSELSRFVNFGPRAPWLPIFPPQAPHLETDGKDSTRAGVIDGNEVISYTGTSQTQISIGGKKDRAESSAAHCNPVWKLPPYFILTYSLEKK